MAQSVPEESIKYSLDVCCCKGLMATWYMDKAFEQ